MREIIVECCVLYLAALLSGIVFWEIGIVMHIHILGICGTFMGSLAILAKQLGYRVSGCDANVYPPMSTQLEAQGIELIEGYDPEQLKDEPDMVVIGNAMSRGNPLVEFVLDKGQPYTSGPQWLQEHVLKDKWVLAAAGTHGKTTTSSMLAWILEYAGMKPGYLIGGVPKNFDVSARLGESIFFVVEADEYDSAFFDKRSKFVHYRPRTVILNNLEFDHADIFPDLAAIQRQFHHLVRTVPANGLLIKPHGELNLSEVIDMGCWTPVEEIDSKKEQGGASEWQVDLLSADGSAFTVLQRNSGGAYVSVGEVRWTHIGDHNVSNALMAIAAARHVGVEPAVSIEALCRFDGVKRRMEELANINGVKVYDDFAHHPTAIKTTLDGLRRTIDASDERQRLIAIIEPRSNTMRLGAHKAQLAQSTKSADKVYWYQPAGLDWDLQSVIQESEVDAELFNNVDKLVDGVIDGVQSGDQLVIMSNGGFEGIHQKLVSALDFEDNYE